MACFSADDPVFLLLRWLHRVSLLFWRLHTLVLVPSFFWTGGSEFSRVHFWADGRPDLDVNFLSATGHGWFASSFPESQREKVTTVLALMISFRGRHSVFFGDASITRYD